MHCWTTSSEGFNHNEHEVSDRKSRTCKFLFIVLNRIWLCFVLVAATSTVCSTDPSDVIPPCSESKSKSGLCDFSQQYGDAFDKACDDDQNSTSKVTDNYCVRKHLVENHFINTTIYPIELNPEKLDVTNTDCDEAYLRMNQFGTAALTNAMSVQISKTTDSAKKCIYDIAQSSFVFELFSVLDLMCLNENFEQRKALEKKKFIAFIEALYVNLVVC